MYVCIYIYIYLHRNHTRENNKFSEVSPRSSLRCVSRNSPAARSPPASSETMKASQLPRGPMPPLPGFTTLVAEFIMSPKRR